VLCPLARWSFPVNAGVCLNPHILGGCLKNWRFLFLTAFGEGGVFQQLINPLIRFFMAAQRPPAWPGFPSV